MRKKLNRIIIYMTSQLPYVQCITCGNQLGHLFSEYYQLSYNLENQNYHNDLLSGNIKPSEVDESLFSTDTGYNIWTSFLKGYYTWIQKGNECNMTIKGLVMQALLADYNLSNEEEIKKHLPFNFSDQDSVRYCCRTALLTDNSKAIY